MPLTRQSQRDVPGQIVQGITPGVWQTIRGPHQGSGSEQALAEYEARVSMPRNDIWGQTLAEDKPENLARELFSPFQRGLQTGMAAVKPKASVKPESRNVGGSLVERNSITGEWEVKIPAQQKPVKDEGLASQRRLLEDRIKAKRRAIIGESDRNVWGPMIDDVLNDESKLEGLFAKPESASAPAAPQSWQVDPQSIPIGSPRSFMGNPALAPSGAAPATAASMSAQARPITTAAEFQALPSGATYIGRNGKTYRKP